MPEATTSTDRAVAAALFATLFVTYAYFFGGSGWNQNASFDLTRSIVERHRLDIDSYRDNTADLSFYGGHAYSNKAPGLSILTAVPYAAIHAWAGAPQASLQLTRTTYVCTLLVCGTSGAGIGLLLFVMLRRRGFSNLLCASIGLVAGLATPLFAYSTMLFAHVPSAFFLLLAMHLIERGRFASAGAALGCASLLSYPSIPAAMVMLGVIGASTTPRLRNVLRLVAGAAPFAIALGWYQVAAFGSPFRTSIATVNPLFRDESAFLGVLSGFRVEALFGITFSPYRGLFYLAPVLLIAGPGLLAMVKRERGTAAIVAFSTTALLVINASFNGWHGGWAIGPRYLLGVVPLLMIAVCYGADRFRLLFALLSAISLLLNVTAAAVDPQPPDKLHDPLGHYEIPALLFGSAGPNDAAVPILVRRFYVGHTSTSRATPDELMPFDRYAPDSPESEWASFNLGEVVFGAGSAASLLPFVAWLAAAATVTLRLAIAADRLQAD